MSDNKKLNLKSLLLEAEKARDEYLEGWKRERATAENREKDFQNKYTLSEQMGKLETIKQFFVVLDSFEKAMKDNKNNDVLNPIYKQVLTIFSSIGVKQILPKKGEVFNPQYHSCIHTIKDEKASEDIIKESVRAGYISEQHVLRPADVIITSKK